MGQIRLHSARFFPPKDLVYFCLKTRHHSKAQTFFQEKFSQFFLDPFKSVIFLTKEIFPPKDLVFLSLFLVAFESTNLVIQDNFLLIFRLIKEYATFNFEHSPAKCLFY